MFIFPPHLAKRVPQKKDGRKAVFFRMINFELTQVSL
jgi:hypothetical protein